MTNKALVAVAAQIDGKGIGRIRLRRISDASSESLQAFITEAIEPGSRVITDGWQGYEGLATLWYKHKSKVIRGSGNRLVQQAVAVQPAPFSKLVVRPNHNV